MTNRKNPVRHQTRFPVNWPLVYGNDKFLAEGTALDLTAIGWRIAGPSPVVPGLRLTLQISVPDKPEPLRIQRATVLWAKGYEFAIKVHEMAPSDQAWVTDFLNKKLGLSWIARSARQRISSETRGAVPSREAGVPHPLSLRPEDILRLSLTCYTPSTNASAEARCDGDSRYQDDEVRTACNCVPEEVWYLMVRLVRGMITMRAYREQTGQDSIANN